MTVFVTLAVVYLVLVVVCVGALCWLALDAPEDEE
jgi:hypothetical protein